MAGEKEIWKALWVLRFRNASRNGRETLARYGGDTETLEATRRRGRRHTWVHKRTG